MTSETTTRVVSARASAATRATYVAFIGSGFAFASWASRIPQVRDRLQLSSADLGLVLLAIAVGSLIALPLAGLIVARLGSRNTVAFMAALLSVGLAGAAVGYLVGMVPLLIGLFLLGFANGAWDVGMNVQGALVERAIGRAIMPRFHAGFSIGTVGGALIGAVMVALDIPVTVHLVVVAVAVVLVVPLWVRRFLPDQPEAVEDAPAPAPAPGVLTRWRESRTLLVGAVVLAFAFAEGAGNDWISVSFIDGYQASAVVGTLGFAVFLTAMTLGRWFGPGLLDRYGRVVVVRGLAVVALVGLVLFIFSPWVGLAFVGALLWGLGASLGFPVGMSAAADDSAAAAGRVSVVASIGYCAFLAGPPLIGFLGESITVLKALITVAVLLGAATLVATSLRPIPDSSTRVTNDQA